MHVNESFHIFSHLVFRGVKLLSGYPLRLNAIMSLTSDIYLFLFWLLRAVSIGSAFFHILGFLFSITFLTLDVTFYLCHKFGQGRCWPLGEGFIKVSYPDPILKCSHKKFPSWDALILLSLHWSKKDILKGFPSKHHLPRNASYAYHCLL